MKLRKIVAVGILGLTLIGGSSLATPISHADATSTSKLEKAADQSGKQLKQLKLTGNWYSMSAKNNGEVISMQKDGTLNWNPINGMGNNTSITAIKTTKGLHHLTISYPDQSKIYGFMKVTTMKIGKVNRQVLLFGTSNQQKPTKKVKFTVATKDKVMIPKNQLSVKLNVN
ncbi:hypothetical protein ACYATM_06315 [Lactobacillaceae bacterium Scapto_B20]